MIEKILFFQEDILKLLALFEFFIMVLFLGSLLLLTSKLFRVNRKKSESSGEILESGIPQASKNGGKYGINFYFIPILYLLFFVSVIFLFPWVLYHGVSLEKSMKTSEFLFYVSILLVACFFVILSKSAKRDK